MVKRVKRLANAVDRNTVDQIFYGFSSQKRKRLDIIADDENKNKKPHVEGQENAKEIESPKEDDREAIVTSLQDLYQD